MKYKPRTKPFPHQARATLKAVRARNFALFLEPRLGKSKAALDYVGILSLKSERPLRVAIISPRIAVEVWAGQIEKHYPGSCTVETFDEKWAHKQRDDRCPARFWLASREEMFRRVRGAKLLPAQKVKIVEEWGPDIIVVDESHEYKRPGARGAQDLWRMVRRLRRRNGGSSPSVVLLTGTPQGKGYRDLFAQFRILDESIFGTSAAEFDERYVTYGVGRRRWTILRYSHEAELKRIIRQHSYTVTAEQAGLAGEQFYERISVRLPDAAKRTYLQLAEEFIAEVEGGVITAANAGVKRLRLLQVVGGFTTDGIELHRAKLEALDSYARLLLEQRESVVVYSRFTPEVEAATETLRRAGFRTFRVDGTVRAADRRRAIASLAEIPEVPTAVSFQYQAGSRSIELVGAAEVVYYSAPDGWVDFRQTAARVTGPNQHRPVRYTFLTVPGSVDVGVIQGLQRKESWHDSLFRDPRAYLLGL